MVAGANKTGWKRGVAKERFKQAVKFKDKKALRRFKRTKAILEKQTEGASGSSEGLQDTLQYLVVPPKSKRGQDEETDGATEAQQGSPESISSPDGKSDSSRKVQSKKLRNSASSRVPAQFREVMAIAAEKEASKRAEAERRMAEKEQREKNLEVKLVARRTQAKRHNQRTSRGQLRMSGVVDALNAKLLGSACAQKESKST